MVEVEKSPQETSIDIDAEKRPVSPEWFLQGALSRIGETFDKLTGRGPRRASSLATSGIIDRLKQLMDKEVRDLGEKGRYVPNNITLKMQWDKFASDNDTQLDKLKNEILTAAVDHINDQRYFTFAPLSLEIKQDYFTDGIVISVGYEDLGENVAENQAEHNVTLPDVDVRDMLPASAATTVSQPLERRVTAQTILTGEVRDFVFVPQMRVTVGRTKENDLVLPDNSVSKTHASLALNSEGDLVVADIGSTNGTFINDERIVYGKAIAVSDGDILKFGNIEIKFDFESNSANIPPPTEVFELPQNSSENSANTFVENRSDEEAWDKNL